MSRSTTTRALCTVAGHLGGSSSTATAAAGGGAGSGDGSMIHTEELLPGISISVYPPDAAESAPFDEMAECVAQSFATYEPSLWGQGLVPGEDACDTSKLEWNLQKTIRLMSTVYVCLTVASSPAMCSRCVCHYPENELPPMSAATLPQASWLAACFCLRTRVAEKRPGLVAPPRTKRQLASPQKRSSRRWVRMSCGARPCLAPPRRRHV
jgi:hypothetical protein